MQALICLGNLLPHLEPWMVSDQIIPALSKINNKEPGILMAILGKWKFCGSRHFVARKNPDSERLRIHVCLFQFFFFIVVLSWDFN